MVRVVRKRGSEHPQAWARMKQGYCPLARIAQVAPSRLGLPLAAEAMRLQPARAAESLWSLAVGPVVARWRLLLEAAAVAQ